MSKKASNPLPPKGLIKPEPPPAPPAKLLRDNDGFVCGECGTEIKIPRQERCKNCGTVFNWYATKRVVY